MENPEAVHAFNNYICVKGRDKNGSKSTGWDQKVVFPNELQQCCDDRVQALSKVGFSHKQNTMGDFVFTT